MAAVVQDWNRLRQVRCWTSLTSISPGAQLVSENLYLIGNDAYALALPSAFGVEVSRDAPPPFVTVLYWARSNGAACRAAQGRIDADDGASGVPPKELWPGKEEPTYVGVRSVARKLGLRTLLERGTYASDGRFIHLVVSVAGLDFCFRENVVQPSDTPYAVGLRCK